MATIARAMELQALPAALDKASLEIIDRAQKMMLCLPSNEQ
jgi:hypothetical protein